MTKTPRPTMVKRWRCYLHQAIDSSGATIDFLLSALLDAAAAKRLFRKALSDPSHSQPRVTNTDGAPICKAAIPAVKRGGDAAAALPVPGGAVPK